MRILHVVSLASADGSAGGPVRVAMTQVAELGRKGHSVFFIGTAENPQLRVTEVPERIFRRRSLAKNLGFAGVFSLPLTLWLWRNAAKYDLVHIHFGRDLVSLAAVIATFRHSGIILQTHGMVDRSAKPIAKLIDPLVRAALRRAAAVICLSEQEQRDVEEVARAPLQAHLLLNAVDNSEFVQSLPRSEEVIYLARLEARKRPLLFAQMAVELGRDFPSVQFTLVGPDQGEAQEVLAVAADLPNGRIVWEGPIPSDQVRDRLSRARVYVLPASNEPFGLTVAEAMSVGTPVVVADDAALAPLILATDSGSVFDGSLSHLVSAVAAYLPNNDLFSRQTINARIASRENFSLTTMVDRLVDIYRDARPRNSSERS